MKTKQVIQIAALAFGALTLAPSMAHGPAKAGHGVTVKVATDVSFDLVVQADGATIYLVDHDEPMSSKGITGKLTVLQGAKKTEVSVKEDGDNALRATGVKLAKGDKVVAVLNNVEGKTATVRFTVQ